MIGKLIGTTILFTTALFATTVVAAAKPARCVIDSGPERYTGPCDFRVSQGGSFTLLPVRGRSLMTGLTSLTVSIVSPGVAEVRGLTLAGVNSRWGEARRSRSDRACWVGEEFSICAY